MTSNSSTETTNSSTADAEVREEITKLARTRIQMTWPMSRDTFVNSNGQFTSFAYSTIIVGFFVCVTLLLAAANLFVQRWTRKLEARKRRIMRSASDDRARIIGGFGSARARDSRAHVKMTMMMTFDKPSTSSAYTSRLIR